MVRINFPARVSSNFVRIPKKIFNEFRDVFEKLNKQEIEIILTTMDSKTSHRTKAIIYLYKVKNETFARMYIKTRGLPKKFKENSCIISFEITS